MSGSDLFLSYRSPDREAVQTVRGFLEARGIKTFLDREKLMSGLPWPQALEEALGTVRAVAVFLSRHGLGLWQKREMGFALDRQVQEEKAGQNFPVIPVLLPGADPTPGFLFLNTWVDLRRDLTGPASLEALVRVLGGEEASRLEEVALCPYRGLWPFCEDHAAFFFGREAFSERLQQTVQNKGLVAVIGPSGSGKSSVVQAGLLPLLRRQRPPNRIWDAVVFRPGDRPFHRLATALTPLLEPDLGEIGRLAEAEALGDHLEHGRIPVGAAIERLLAKSDGTDRLLLVADQFEELFTLAPEPTRQPFVEALLKALSRSPLTLMLTLRADFYGHAISLSRDLSDSMEQALVNLGPMRREELQRAIEEPARRVGLQFEEGLVETILGAVACQPGSLPLLEHSLLELWNRRGERKLTLKAYRESGGVEGAIAKRAHEIYETFSPEQKAIARRMLLRLTQPGEGTEDTRRRVAMSELISFPEEKEAVEKVVCTLADARLLTTSGDDYADDRWVDVSHEALIRGWPRLRQWIEEDRASLRVHRRLTEAAQEWQRLDQDEGVLYRSARLVGAVEWPRSHEAWLNELEREFLSASVELRDREQAAREEEKRRLQEALTTAEEQHSEAERQRQIAVQQAARAESRALASAAISTLGRDPDLSLLLALEAVSILRSAGVVSVPEVEDALHRSVQASRVHAFSSPSLATPHSSLASPSRRMASGSPPPATMGPPRSGRPNPGRSSSPSSGTPLGSMASPSARMGSAWPQPPGGRWRSMPWTSKTWWCWPRPASAAR